MKLHSTLDWLRFTVPHDLQIEDVLPFDWAIPVRLPSPLTPYPSYNTALKMRIGRVDWHDGRPEQRKMFTLTGDDFMLLARENFNVDMLLMAMSKVEKLNVTRLDFAVDVYEPGIRANEVYQAFERGGLKTQSKTVRRVQSGDAPRNFDPATTVYIGARSSVAMLRVYDKGKQQRLDIDWVRIEIEAKQEKAGKLAGAMLMHGIHDAGCEAIKGAALVDVDWWLPALDGNAELDLSLGRRETDWEKWVRETVIPNFERAVKTDANGAREALRTLHEKYKDLLI